MRGKWLVVMLPLLIAASAQAYDPGLHVYIGSRTFEVWQNFDAGFYSALKLPDSDTFGFYTRKLYYIGLTLPDMLDAGVQVGICSLLTRLHDTRDSIDSWAGRVNVALLGPLHITDTTYDQVQTVMAYDSLVSPMNYNFPAVCSMARYVRSRPWPAPCKALIYGCYMHIIEDLFCGEVLLPSRFGYGYAIDSDSALNKFILSFGELYYELFSGTHVQESDWQECTESGLFEGWATLGGDSVVMKGGYLDFFPLLGREIQGREKYKQISGWQQRYFGEHSVAPYLDSFASVTNRFFGMNNLTGLRLHTYLHGWAMLLFMGYGYDRNPDWPTNLNFGGPMAHPDWTPVQAANFLDRIGDDFFSVSVKPAWWIDVVGDVIGWGVGRWGGVLLWEGIMAATQNKLAEVIAGSITQYMPYSSLRDSIPEGQQYPWCTYWQTPDDFDVLWGALPAFMRNVAAQGGASIHENTRVWNTYAQVKAPNLQASYQDEVPLVLGMSDLFARAVAGGPDSMCHSRGSLNVIALSRKAGLTGGIYDVPSEDYVRQPGVLYAGFKVDDDTVWSAIGLHSQGDPEKVKLVFDLVTFGPTKVLLKSKNGSGQTFLQAEADCQETGPHHWHDSLTRDGPPFVAASICSLWFDIETKNSADTYAPMLSSKYDQAYWAQSHPEIHNSIAYQTWFDGGNSARTEAQNPFAEPDSFWPYALPIHPQDGEYILAPILAPATTIQEGIHLTWQNRSSCADRVVILRSVDAGGFNRYDSVGPDTSAYLDAEVDYGHSYDYRVVACHDTFASELSNTTSVSEDLHWQHRSDVPMNAKLRKVRNGGSLAGLDSSNDVYVYALKGSNTCEFYRYGVTTNHFWTAKESIPAVGSTGTARRPFKGAALTTGSDGKLYAVKGNNTREFWRYDPALSGGGTYPWSEMDTVPHGPVWRRVKEGAGLAAATVGDSSYIYLLKGSNTCEFYRYNTQSGAWATMPSAPDGPAKRKFKDGSCITYDPENSSIYALKGGTNEFYSYSVTQNTWASSETMPRIGQSGRKKYAKYGTALAYESGRVYALKGVNTNDLSVYRPDQHAWAIACSLPLYPSTRKVSRGGALTAIAGHLWALRGNNTLDFWRYTLGQDDGLAAGPGEPGPGPNEFLVASGAGAVTPRWSPDGSWVVFTKPDGNASQQAFRASASGGTPTVLTSLTGNVTEVCPSPNGTQVAFAFVPDGSPYSQIGVVPSGGGQATILTSGSLSHEGICWRMDGSGIFYASDAAATGCSQLGFVPANGGPEQTLTSTAHGHDFPKSLTQDELVVEGEDSSGYMQLYRVNICLGQEAQITSGECDHTEGTVAPSTRTVAYQVTDQDGNTRIARMSVNGGQEVFLTCPAAGSFSAPSITTDGQKLVCVREGDSGSSLWEINAWSGEATQITDECADRETPDDET
jgi:Tol biopolymer transport system component